jgi:RNA-binding protein YlmH
LQIFVSAPLGDYVQDSLTEISRYGVALKKTPGDAARSIEPEFTVMDIIVPSMRLDAVIHGAYKLSRNDASDYIKAQKVSVNHAPALKPAVNLKPGDIVSVRTKGRLIVDGILGTTHKENIRLRIKKFS